MSNIRKPLLGELLDYGNPFTKGLVGCWLMNEGSGNTVQDLSGNNYSGAIIGPTWVGGNTGPALYFTTNDYVKFTNPRQFFGENFTIVFGASYDSGGGGRIFDWDEFNNSGISITLAATLNVEINYAGGAQSKSSSWGTNPTDTFAQYAVVHTMPLNSQIEVFFNGGAKSAVFNYDHSLVLPGDTTEAYFGSNEGLTSFYKGHISYIYLYNRALSASEIQQLYREPFCMFDRDPIELWSAAQGGGAPATTILPQITSAYMGI